MNKWQINTASRAESPHGVRETLGRPQEDSYFDAAQLTDVLLFPFGLRVAEICPRTNEGYYQEALQYAESQ